MSSSGMLIASDLTGLLWALLDPTLPYCALSQCVGSPSLDAATSGLLPSSGTHENPWRAACGITARRACTESLMRLRSVPIELLMSCNCLILGARKAIPSGHHQAHGPCSCSIILQWSCMRTSFEGCQAAHLGMQGLLLRHGSAELILLVVHCAQVNSRQPHQGREAPQHVQQAGHAQVGMRPVWHACRSWKDLGRNLKFCAKSL